MKCGAISPVQSVRGAISPDTVDSLGDLLTVSKASCLCVRPAEATLKKKFVSCPGGGSNKSQSGGREIFFFYRYFFYVIKDKGNIQKKKEKNPPNLKKIPSWHL